jgi:hypothetical protein
MAGVRFTRDPDQANIVQRREHRRSRADDDVERLGRDREPGSIPHACVAPGEDADALAEGFDERDGGRRERVRLGDDDERSPACCEARRHRLDDDRLLVR